VLPAVLREVQVDQKERSFKILAVATSLVAATSAVYAANRVGADRAASQYVLDTVVLALIAVVAEEMAVEVRDRVTMTAGNLPILLAIMFLGPLPAMAVAAVVGFWGAWRETSRAVVVYNCSQLVISAFVAAETFAALKSHLSIPLDSVSLILLGAGALAAVLYEAVNNLLISLAALTKYGTSLVTYWRDDMPSLLIRSLVFVVGLGLAVAALYATAGITAVALLFIPVFASQYLFKLLVRERSHVAKQEELTDKYLEMNLGLAVAMVVLLDSKDEYTADHSAAVAMYCRDMALASGMSENEAEEIHLAGLLHDLGKVGTPDAILRKDSTLDDDEWVYIRQHPEKGAEVLSHLAAYQNVADIVRYHHERLDGTGYPLGLRSESIPDASKMLAVADTYHAMTSDRPYRRALSSFEALKELRSMAGVALDARYVEVLAGILRDKDLAYRDGSVTDFMDEYQRGRLNLRLRGEAVADLSGIVRAREDPAAG
jgi:putative nucleotidyltransferase with HDIG domain